MKLVYKTGENSQEQAGTVMLHYRKV